MSQSERGIKQSTGRQEKENGCRMGVTEDELCWPLLDCSQRSNTTQQNAATQLSECVDMLLTLL